ncbi:beta-glucosidase [Chitinophaga silvatica]|uniref:Beta-glucosidase n=1 Tax=Chitinophaga silvatica TaxID=2282649 RepID=A0A3E1Y5I6_9BACT|nr:glucoamylase family protein [Chitinophaga silvatica]RFS19999.1 beta-glucosidase [Chitinophaga silvatica]
MKQLLISICLSVILLPTIACNKSGKPISTATDSSVAVNKTLLDKTQQGCFQYFWQLGKNFSGMAPERATSTSGNTVTTGGSGFGVMATICAIERGWITRAEGTQRILDIVHFLDKADKFHGAWSHWMNGETGKAIPFGNKGNAGDLVETSFMMAGLLSAKAYLAGNTATEVEIRQLTDKFYQQIEWNWYTNNTKSLYWGWYPQNNYFELPISGWNESLITYILALGAPKHGITPEIYTNGWTRNGNFRNGNTFYGYKQFLGRDRVGPLFLSHYSFLGLDPHKMQDQYTSYIQQNINHTLINRAYCLTDAPKTYLYASNQWGLSAADGADGYRAHAPDEDEGTIAPTAALSAIPFTPYYSMQVLQHFMNDMGYKIWGVYGFHDAFNVSRNWYDNQYLAIDQGPIVVMIENYRSGKIWDLLMSAPEVKLGLQLAGITTPVYETGFPEAVPESTTGYYDMLLHPDKGVYEIAYYLKESGASTGFTLLDSKNKTIRILQNVTPTNIGLHTLSFDATNINTDQPYILQYTANEKRTSINVKFH